MLTSRQSHWAVKRNTKQAALRLSLQQDIKLKTENENPFILLFKNTIISSLMGYRSVTITDKIFDNLILGSYRYQTCKLQDDFYTYLWDWDGSGYAGKSLVNSPYPFPHPSLPCFTLCRGAARVSLPLWHELVEIGGEREIGKLWYKTHTAPHSIRQTNFFSLRPQLSFSRAAAASDPAFCGERCSWYLVASCFHSTPKLVPVLCSWNSSHTSVFCLFT